CQHAWGDAPRRPSTPVWRAAGPHAHSSADKKRSQRFRRGSAAEPGFARLANPGSSRRKVIDALHKKFRLPPNGRYLSATSSPVQWTNEKMSTNGTNNPRRNPVNVDPTPSAHAGTLLCH